MDTQAAAEFVGRHNGGASPSTTAGTSVKTLRNQRNPGSNPDRTSQPASMVRSRGGNPSENAMPIHARVETKVLHGDASGGDPLDAAYRQSRPLEQSRVGRCGAEEETRAIQP